MNTELNQKISQLLDDDLHLLEQQQILRKISQQTELFNKMNRYQTVSQVLKNNHDFVMSDSDFLSKVNEELKDVPSYDMPRKAPIKKAGNFWRNTSLAVAASVAVISFIVSQQVDMEDTLFPSDGSLLVAEQQLIIVPEDTVSQNLVEEQRANQVAAAIQHERLKAYLQAHSNDMYTHGKLGVQPFARMATFGKE